MSATNKSKSNSKPAAKPAAKAAKSAAKATAKPASKAAKPAKPAAKPAVGKAAKSVAKSPAKPAAKPVAKAAEKNSKAKPEKAKVDKAKKETDANLLAKPAKAPKATLKPTAKTARKGEDSSAEAGSESVADAEFAEDFAASEANELEEASAEPVVPAEDLSPSAALLRSMKPTPPDAEKAGDKKKKKDDLKLDRNGDLEAQWVQIKEKYKALKPVAYKMSESFEARTPVLHKVLGWGFIISNQNDRLEVLFQQGIKFLISNYKA